MIIVLPGRTAGSTYEGEKIRNIEGSVSGSHGGSEGKDGVVSTLVSNHISHG